MNYKNYIEQQKKNLEMLLNICDDINRENHIMLTDLQELKKDKEEKEKLLKEKFENRLKQNSKLALKEREILKASFGIDNLSNKINSIYKDTQINKFAFKIVVKCLDICASNLLKAVLKEYISLYSNSKTPLHYKIVGKRLNELLNSDNISINHAFNGYHGYSIYIKDITLRTNYLSNIDGIYFYNTLNKELDLQNINVIQSKDEAKEKAIKGFKLKELSEQLKKEFEQKLSEIKDEYRTLTFNYLQDN